MTIAAQTDRPKGACTLCDVVKPDGPALQDHVLNVHPDEHCGIYHQQPCQHDRRERYLAALLAADPYALLERRDDRTRLADAVMAVADAEIPAVLRAVADLIDSNSKISAAVHATTEMRRIADQMQYGDDAEMAASYRRDGFGPDEIAELLRTPDTAEEQSAACGRCKQPFDPNDTRFDGHAQHKLTPYCRRCTDLCHDNESADHRCVICA